MQIFVQMWSEFDPILNLSVSREDNNPKTAPEDKLYKVSGAAISGVNSALSLPNSEVTAFCIGERHKEGLRLALAMGVRRAILFKTNQDEFSDFREDSALLLSWIQKKKIFPQLIIGSRVCGVLAAKLNYSFLSGLESFKLQDNKVSGRRVAEKGARELVVASLPVGICLRMTKGFRPYISLDRLNQADSKEIEIEIESLEKTSAPEHEKVNWGLWQPFRPRTRSATKSNSGAIVSGAKTKSGLNRFEALMGTNRKAAKPKVNPTSKVTSEEPSISEQSEKLLRYLIHHELIDTQEKSSDGKPIS